MQRRSSDRRMLNLRHAMLVLAVLLAMLGDSSGQSLRPQQQNDQPNPSAQTSPANQREQTSPVVKPAPNDSEDKSNADWWLVKLTAVLGAIGFLQLLVFGYQAWQLKRTVDATREIGKAAILIEQPIIRSGRIGPELEHTDQLITEPNIPYGSNDIVEWPTQFSVVSDVSFRNYGRTPAFPNRIRAGIAVVDKLPDTPNYSRVTPSDSDEVIQPGQSTKIMLDFGFELSNEQLEILKQGVLRLWFFILLEYRDASDFLHEAGFCLGGFNRSTQHPSLLI
jgi:hypothetical protein